MMSLNRYFFVLVILIGFYFSLDAKADAYWNDIPQANIQSSGERLIVPEKFRTITLNVPEIKAILNAAPMEKNVRPANSNSIVTLPMPDGRNLRFRFVESPVMEEALSNQFPAIKTYMGQGIDDPYTSVRFDITPLGFHAMIFTLNDVAFIDPYAKNDNYNYISYYKSNFRTDKQFNCELLTDLEHNHKNVPHSDMMDNEGQLRTYRTVIACTGEYAAFFGGTQVAALAAIVVSLNRVNGVYEKEASVRMILVTNNIAVVYTNASTDPYTNNNGGTMLGQNQTAVDQQIGTANYDIGHVFSTGGGGVAQLGCVCAPGSKAQGVTGSGAPVGDPFDIDYVAHEMGHQFGGNHTFNSVTSACGGGNRFPNAAYEPGSGSTIMAYAGICGSTNLQNNSDAYFHTKSLDEIINFTSIGGGNSCAVLTTTGNHHPVVTVPADGFAIPKSTPFELTGSATDPDVGDVLTYSWEQYDLGPGGAPGSPLGNAPIFRSFNAVTTGYRVFPKLSNLLNNTTTIGEILPTYERSLSFRLTARDNKITGGGRGTGFMSFGVDATAGPFLVTSPNTNVTWNTPYVQTVTWDVANTNAASINCGTVDILLSTDGGNTFPTVLAAGTANDGSQGVTLPSVNSTTARIKVRAVGNIFFDISNANFTMSTSTGVGNNTSAPLTFKLDQNFPNPFNPSTMINFTIPKMSNVTLKVYDMKGQLIGTLINNEVRTEGNYSFEFDASSLASGMYFYKLEAGNSIETRKMILMK